MIKTLFMGRKKVAANCLEWLSLTCPDFEIVGVVTDSHLKESCTSQIAMRLGLPLLDYESAMSLAEKERIDLGLSILYWRKLKGALLFQKSKYGCINFHPALLPDYKGCAGYNLAIMDGLLEWGSSCHYVDEGIDTGDIIDVLRFPVDDLLETAQSLERKTLHVMEEQFKKVITRLNESSSARLDSAPNIGGRYVSRKEMEMMKRVLPVDDPDRKARAFYFPPYEGAWVEVNGQRVNIIPASVLRYLGDHSASSLFSSSSLSAAKEA